MTGDVSPAWLVAGMVIHALGALTCAVAALWLLRWRRPFGAAGPSMIAGLLVTTLWCLVSATSGGDTYVTGYFEVGRNLAWLLVVYRLFASDGRHTALAPIRPLLLAVVLVEMLQLMLGISAVRYGGPDGLAAIFHLTVLFSLLAAVGSLVLVHNLYVSGSNQARLMLRWPGLALAVMWGYDLNLYTIAYLASAWPAEIAALRGLAVIAAGLFLLLAAVPGRQDMRLLPSRTVTFQTISLLVIGAYLVGMVAFAQWLSLAGGNFSRLAGVGFLIAACAIAIIVLPSRRLRSWFKVILAKHLFQHRYDYREEWLRLTRTIGNAGSGGHSLEERVVQSVADIADSQAGLLLASNEHGELVLAARWQWPSAEVPAVAMGPAAVGFFERTGHILDLDDLREGATQDQPAAILPGWLREDSRAWALIPLLHYKRLVGVVVLTRPLHARKFDWEDFDLLKVAGQQLASYLAEHAGQSALADASRFDDFHRRIAFVMHDIKNLASQLSLLARNAERHADNPEFRDDMLLTLRNSADKLNALLARLSRYGPGTIERMEEVRVDEAVKAVARQFDAGGQVVLAQCIECTALASRETLEQVLVHLVQNAIDASAPDSPVFLNLSTDGLHARIEVVDSGCGMSPDFVRTKLFKPFVSSKPGGFGIGAFEARELVRAMRGRLDVESREGLGSRFMISLPRAAASELLNSIETKNQRVAR
jgi:putative PEP-CTERM system histidine kinase